MERIKEPAVINMFYSGNKDILKKQITDFKNNSNCEYNYPSRAVIVPHAGLIYSGQLAFDGINCLDKNIKNIFIFAPAHKTAFSGLSLSGFDKWKTPLGDIELNKEIIKELEEKFGAKIYDEAFENEHSVEIEVPIVQSVFNNVKIIPVLIGYESPDIITKIIEEYYKYPDFGFIISSDLSHFLTDEKAKQIDLKTAKMIETSELNGFSYEQACGAVGIYGIGEFANKKDFSLIRVGMYNSSKISNDKNRVVGYGSWFLYEGGKNKFIKEYYSNYMLKLVRDVISSKFNKSEVITNHTPVFDEDGACFVTLKKFGNLRGCIGSIIAHRPLIEDLVVHSKNSAYHDPRFKPVEENEIKDLKINISLLSKPKPIEFSNEEDLLNKIIPNIDGIIIKDKGYQAVYLPSVWEELPDKEVFLKSLKMKAGLSPDYFSKTFEAYRFRAEYIEE